jgi:hypothetical protein
MGRHIANPVLVRNQRSSVGKRWQCGAWSLVLNLRVMLKPTLPSSTKCYITYYKITSPANKKILDGCQWLTPVIEVQTQPRQIVQRSLS